MEEIRIQNKIKVLFEKLVDPNYVMNSYYADGLINRLSNGADPEISFLGTIPLTSDLIVDALNHIDNVHITSKVFLIRMLAITAAKELHYTKLACLQGNKILNAMKALNTPDMNPSLRVALMEVALSLVGHSSGISWLLKTGIWKEILSLCNEKTTIFVVRQTYKFATEFLWKLNDLGDQANIKNVLTVILKPVLTVNYINIQSMSSEEEEEHCRSLEPMLHTMLSIFCHEQRILQRSILIDIILKEFKITSHLYIINDWIRKEEITLLICKLIFLSVLAKIFLGKPKEPNVEYEIKDFLELKVTWFNVVQYYIQRGSANGVIDFCTSCSLLWCKICKDVDPKNTSSNTEIKLKNQMLFMCMVPILVFLRCGRTASQMSGDSLNDYLVKLLNASCEATARAAYALRDLILELDTLPIILQSIKKLTCLKQHMNDEQANLVFQALFYVLRDYDPIDDYGEMKTEQNYVDSEEKVLVMTYVIDIVLSLVKNHNINWQESLEVICLYTVVHNILKRPNLTCKFIVIALNVIAMCVKKFLPPNLSLLLESKPGSSLHELGKLIFLRLHDLNWEVRDSALELLLVCTDISYIKFPPFQKQILENKLINVAATIAFNDHESYVQVSALKCVGAASKISVMWDQLKQEYPDIQERLISILRNNQEGIVRKEACNVLCDLYQNIKLSNEYKQILYEHMVSSALCDFHWEVQLSALKFWRIVFHSLLTNQGMLDGVFPPVTFSKQSRKIVTLNETEIQRRLMMILEELASMGSLTVYLKLLHDDTEVEIMDTALTISLELLDILNRYKVPECLKSMDGDPTTVEELLSNIKDEREEWSDCEEMTDIEITATSDKVIEGILNADDINLLANIYDTHMSLHNNPCKPEILIKPKIKLLKFASPYLFVKYIQSKDFKIVVDEKRKWNDGIRNVSSLLDDVLGIYAINEEANSLDCY